MNKNLIVSMVLCVLWAPCFAQAPTWNPSWNPQYAPTTERKLADAIHRNSKDAAILIKLIEKSRAFRFGEVAFRTLNAIRQQHPDSVDTQAAFCWAYLQDIDTAFGKEGDYRARNAQEQSVFDVTLRRAKTLKPTHWLVALIGGYRAYAKGANNFRVALPLLKAATESAPNDRYVRAYCWSFYGAALSGAAMRGYVDDGQRVTFQRSTQALEKSAKIDPRQTATWLTLFSIYTNLKDEENALRAKRGFLRALPPERRSKLPKWAKGMLDEYPD